MLFQHTLLHEIQAVGIGLHGGEPIRMTLKPAPPNTGVVFVRTDLDGVSLKAAPENIDFPALKLATAFRRGDVVVQTTEHLLSALYGFGVDNVFVEVDGPEIPILDGSAEPFLMLLEEAGRKEQPCPAKVLRITKPFVFEEGEKKVWVQPSEGYRISYEIEFDHPMIRRQTKTVLVDGDGYENQIAAARTFGFLRDVNALKSMGLIKGGNMDNAVVLDSDRVVNGDLRMKDEFVSHKILDFIGDLFVAGYRLQGHFSGYKAGHEMHAKFLTALLAADDCYVVEQGVRVEDQGMGAARPAYVA